MPRVVITLVIDPMLKAVSTLGLRLSLWLVGDRKPACQSHMTCEDQYKRVLEYLSRYGIR